MKVLKPDFQTLHYDDGTGDDLAVPRGGTVLASGYTTYSLLSADDQAFARSTKLQYAPHPYTWLAGAQSRSDDLGMNERGARDAVPAIEAENIPLLPMCWRNPLTGQLALQIQPSAVETLLLADGTVLDELEEVREIVHRMQRPGVAPGLVRAVDWEEGVWRFLKILAWCIVLAAAFCRGR